jgi:hypothetical protein
MNIGEAVYKCMDWIQLEQGRVEWRAFSWYDISHSIKAENSVTMGKTISFLREIQYEIVTSSWTKLQLYP